MSTKRNYFAGVPVITGYEYGRFLSQSGQKALHQLVGFSGNQGAYGRALPLIYGKCRISDPILLVANATGTFLTCLFAVGEGPFATNATDESQSDLLAAYCPDPSPPPNYSIAERYLRVSGQLRHDPRPGFGLQLGGGAQDQPPPDSTIFFPNSIDFSTNELGLWGTAWVILRIDTSNHPAVDLNGGTVSGTFGVQYGKLVRIYSLGSYPTNVLSKSPVGYWKLAEPSGSIANDSSGNAINGTYANSPTLGVTGIPGDPTDTAVTFNGTNQHVDIGDASVFHFGSGGFTVKAWFQTTAPNTHNWLVSKMAAGVAQGWYMSLDYPGTLGQYFITVQARTSGASIVLNFSTPAISNLADGNWHEAVFTWDGSTGANAAEIWVDGVLKASATAVSGTPDYVSASLTIGDSADYLAPANATIGQVSLYAGVQSSGDILAEYQTGDGIIPPTNLVTRKATTNASWVLADAMTSRRGGAGTPWSQINVASFIAQAAYNNTLVNDVINAGATVPRFTFNGCLDSTKSFDEWISLICLAQSSTKPFLDINGQYKVNTLSAVGAGLSSVPLFNDNQTDGSRNILWANGKTTLRRFWKRRRDQIPNRIYANFVNLSNVVGYVLSADAAAGANLIHLDTSQASGQFLVGGFFSVNGQGSYQITGVTNVGGLTTQLQFVPGLQTGTSGIWPRLSRITDLSDFLKVQVVVEDEQAQDLPNGQRQIVEKTIDLLGCSTLDQAARVATLVLRVGEFAEGGIDNNAGIKFSGFAKDVEDLEIGTVFQAESATLDPVEERYWRVSNINDRKDTTPDGAIVYIRDITAMAHTEESYDDTAFTVHPMQPYVPSGTTDAPPDPVTGFAISESGYFDANNTLMAKLTFTFTPPNNNSNWRSGLVFRCHDTSGSQVGDWSLVGEVFQSGDQLEYPVSGKYEWFALVSRPLSGSTPQVDALNSDGVTYTYPRVRLLVDGMNETTLSAPTGLAAFGREGAGIFLTWNPFTNPNDHALYKGFNVYRTTTSTPPGSGATPIGYTDGTSYIDASSTVVNAPATTFFYWISGVTRLQGTTINGVFQTGTGLNGLAESGISSFASQNAGTDAAVPGAPGNVQVVRATAGQILIGVDAPITNFSTIQSWDLQVTTDATFATFPAGLSIDTVGTGTPIAQQLPDIVTFILTQPGTYYIRARANNIFGSGPWAYYGGSSPGAYQTGASINATDTDVPDAPINLQLLTSSSANVAGNAYRELFKYGQNNMTSVWGWTMLLYTSNTLPNPTMAYDGTGGSVTAALTAGSNRIQITGTTGWSVNQWITGGTYDLVIFSPKRPASPDSPLEGMLDVVKIIGNGTNFIDINLDPQAQFNTYSGLKFYIVQEGGNNHVWEKCTAYLLNQVDVNPNGVTRQHDFAVQQTGLYAFALVHSAIWGAGKIAVTGATGSFAGLTSLELGSSSVTNSKLGTSSVTYDKVSISQLSAISADCGTITAGTLTGTTIQTAASGARVDMTSANGLQCYDGGGTVRSRLNTGALAGFIQATEIHGISGDLDLFSNNGFTEVTIGTAGFSVNISSSGVLSVDSSGVTATGSHNFNVNSGFGLASGGTSVALTTLEVQQYISSSLVAKMTGSSSSSASNLWILKNGVLTNVLIDGSGYLHF